MANKLAQFTPKTPNLDLIADHKANKDAVAGSPVLPTWQALRDKRFARFEALGEAGARGKVSLNQVQLGFAAACANGELQADNAKQAYLAYCGAYNATMAAMPDFIATDLLEVTEDSAGFKASVSTLRSYGSVGALAQGADIATNPKGKAYCASWSPRFYSLVKAAWMAADSDLRVDTIGKAFYAANVFADKLAEGYANNPWTVRALTEDEIATLVLKKGSVKTDLARFIKAGEAAAKAGKRLSPTLENMMKRAIEDCVAAYETEMAVSANMDRAQSARTIGEVTQANVAALEF